MSVRELQLEIIISNKKNICTNPEYSKFLEQTYEIQDKRWKRYKSGFVFVYPKTHVFCHDDPMKTQIDPWGRVIRKWKYFDHDIPSVWHTRSVTNDYHKLITPNDAHKMATYFAYTSINDVWIALYLIHQGIVSTCEDV